MSYYAVSAKVHALYGHRMTEEDYRQLTSKKTVPEAAAFLQAHPGYRSQLAGLNTSNIHREALENAMRSAYVDEYRRIFSFMSMEDKDLMQFLLYRAEQDAILTAMRQLTSTHMLEPTMVWDPVLRKKSTLDAEALEKTTCFADIVHAAEHSIYGSTLQRILVGDSKTPTQSFVDNMMQITYFSQLYKTVGKRYSGDAKKLLRQSLDNETDLINLVQFLRLKKHFTQEDVQRYSFPLPNSAKLKKEYIQQLIAAPDYDSAFQLILDGPYGKLFRSIAPLGLEAYLYTLQYQFARRQLRAAAPTIYTPIAYLTLKEIELRNIISIIECIRYGGDPDAYVTLIGLKR
jgi:V/A-type H+-transporting ATPase subunit C